MSPDQESPKKREKINTRGQQFTRNYDWSIKELSNPGVFDRETSVFLFLSCSHQTLLSDPESNKMPEMCSNREISGYDKGDYGIPTPNGLKAADYALFRSLIVADLSCTTSHMFLMLISRAAFTC